MVDDKAFAKLNGKLRLGIGPSHARVSPLGSDVAQGAPDQLGGSLVVSKLPLVAYGLRSASKRIGSIQWPALPSVYSINHRIGDG